MNLNAKMKYIKQIDLHVENRVVAAWLALWDKEYITSHRGNKCAQELGRVGLSQCC